MPAPGPVTAWYRREWDENLKAHVFAFNHLEDGHAAGEYPEPKLDREGKPFASQSGWKKGVWRKEHRRLTAERVVE